MIAVLTIKEADTRAAHAGEPVAWRVQQVAHGAVDRLRDVASITSDRLAVAELALLVRELDELVTTLRAALEPAPTGQPCVRRVTTFGPFQDQLVTVVWRDVHARLNLVVRDGSTSSVKSAWIADADLEDVDGGDR